jgi:hypothetical protein
MSLAGVRAINSSIFARNSSNAFWLTTAVPFFRRHAVYQTAANLPFFAIDISTRLVRHPICCALLWCSIGLHFFYNTLIELDFCNGTGNAERNANRCDEGSGRQLVRKSSCRKNN